MSDKNSIMDEDRVDDAEVDLYQHATQEAGVALGSIVLIEGVLVVAA